jgi:hypothetical protein
MDAQSQAQIVLVFVAITDEERFSGKAQGKSRQKFRFGPDLQADLIFGTIFDYVLDDLFSLVDLHRKYGLICPFIGKLINGT